MPQVTFMPDNITVEVGAGENLLRAAMAADVRISAPCGGDGTCGKCRMVLKSGPTAMRPNSRLTDEELAQGYVLACVTHVEGDVIVHIPPESRPGAVPARVRGRKRPNPMLSAEEWSSRVPCKRMEPPVAALSLTLNSPDLSDNASDAARLRQGLRRAHRIADIDIPLETIRLLPDVLRAGEWTITAFVADTGKGIPRLCSIRPGDVTDRHFAVACDIGTTTVEAALISLPEGSVLAREAEYNEQVRHGEDVISRIIAASTDEGLECLRSLVVTTISRLVDRMCEESGVAPEEIACYVAAGNTVMTHLLLGVTPRNIRTAPYIPAASAFPVTSARSVGLQASEGAPLITVPCPASWLGGDIVAGLVASGIPWSEKMTLFVDIGTNGEIVLGSKEWLVGCSCSAGPTFEGGGITHGMRAADGAIEQVRIDTDTLEPMILSIGSIKPLGVCGSGLIDCVSELFLSGAIDRNGVFARNDSERIRTGARGVEYLLVRAEDSGTARDIVITETDIENVIRAKAAVFAGISVLLESVDIDIADIGEVIVAGGFGHYLDLDHVMTLGMLPELPAARYRFIGNGSLLGTRLMATSREALEKAHRVSETLTYLELSVNAGFMNMYTSSMFLPHTDLSLFPQAERKLAARAKRAAVR